MRVHTIETLLDVQWRLATEHRDCAEVRSAPGPASSLTIRRTDDVHGEPLGCRCEPLAETSLQSSTGLLNAAERFHTIVIRRLDKSSWSDSAAADCEPTFHRTASSPRFALPAAWAAVGVGTCDPGAGW